MKACFRNSITSFLTIWMISFLALPASASAAEAPDKIVGDATSRVIQLLKTEKDIYAKNPSKFYSDVELIIDPVIAFDEMGRGVMGKYAHRATDSEIERFTKVFRDSLVEFYSNAVQSFDTSQLSLGKVDQVSADVLKEYEAGKSRSIPVGLKIRSKDTEYAMSYSVMKKDGQWKVRNIVVEGINIGIQFRNQFQDAMNKYRSIAKVIDKWPALMQQSEQDQKDKSKS